MEEKPKVKSLEKALKILECFTVEAPELGITEISHQLDLYKSNVYNLVSTFEQCGYLEQNSQTGKYRLGHSIMKLSHVISTTMGFHSIVKQSITDLARQIDETVYFGIPDGENVMYMEGAFPEKYNYNMRSIQGMTAPMVCTAIGKAMLAYMQEEFIETILEKPMERFTDYTITDPQVMKEELKKIRERGYSTDNMEHEYGIKCVGVPILNHNGEVIGALSATGPSLRFSEEQSNLFVELLKDKAEFLSTRI